MTDTPRVDSHLFESNPEGIWKEARELERELADAKRSLDRLGKLVTPDKNMAEQIARYLDGRAMKEDGSSMEYMQLRRASEWMRSLTVAPDAAYVLACLEVLRSVRESMATYETDYDPNRIQCIAEIDAVLAKSGKP